MGTQISALCEGRWAVGLCYQRETMNLCVAVTTTWIWVEAHGVPFPCSQLGMQGSPGRICNILPFKNQVSSRIQEEDEKRRRNKELLSSAFPCCPGCCLLVLGVFWTPEIPAVLRWNHSIIASSFPIWKYFSPWDFVCIFRLVLWSSLSHLISVSLPLATWILSWNVMQWDKCSQFWESRSWGTETGSLQAVEKFCGLLPGLGSTGAPGLSWGKELWLGSALGCCKHREFNSYRKQRGTWIHLVILI